MFKFKVNQQEKTFDGDGDTPLLWVLRDSLKMHGTKFGCGEGVCGACTVHLNGEPTRSCQTPVSMVNGRSITTVEGLAATPTGRAVQAAWLDLEVMQCGYCQAGQMMSATALLNRTHKPSDEDIDSAMAGNLCRCGTYTRIRAAIRKASGQAVTGQVSEPAISAALTPLSPSAPEPAARNPGGAK